MDEKMNYFCSVYSKGVLIDHSVHVSTEKGVVFGLFLFLDSNSTHDITLLHLAFQKHSPYSVLFFEKKNTRTFWMCFAATDQLGEFVRKQLADAHVEWSQARDASNQVHSLIIYKKSVSEKF